MCKNLAHLARYSGSVFVSMTGCKNRRLSWFLSKSLFRLFDWFSEIIRNYAEFLFLILIFHRSQLWYRCWTSLVCAGVFQPGSSLPAERWLRSAAASTRPHSLGCECESAVVPETRSPPLLRRGAARGQQPGDWPLCLARSAPGAVAQRVEQAELLESGGEWTMASAAADVIIWFLQTDSHHGVRPRRCLQPARPSGSQQLGVGVI